MSTTSADQIVNVTTLYSVITNYAPGQTIAEHFPTRQARRNSLIQRVQQCLQTPDELPQDVLVDEERLAQLASTLLMPATITLTEASLDESDGVYRPVGRLLSVL